MPTAREKGQGNGSENVRRELVKEWGVTILLGIAALACFLLWRYFDGGDGGSRVALRSVDGGLGEEGGEGVVGSDVAV